MTWCSGWAPYAYNSHFFPFIWSKAKLTCRSASAPSSNASLWIYFFKSLYFISKRFGTSHRTSWQKQSPMQRVMTCISNQVAKLISCFFDSLNWRYITVWVYSFENRVHMHTSSMVGDFARILEQDSSTEGNHFNYFSLYQFYHVSLKRIINFKGQKQLRVGPSSSE